MPSTTLSAAINIPPPLGADDIRIEVDLNTFAYVSNTDPAFQTASADYSNTLVAHRDAETVGASTVGVSGFDYASSVTPSVPELSTWMRMLLGFAALGFGGYRKARSAATVAA